MLRLVQFVPVSSFSNPNPQMFLLLCNFPWAVSYSLDTGKSKDFFFQEAFGYEITLVSWESQVWLERERIASVCRTGLQHHGQFTDSGALTPLSNQLSITSLLPGREGPVARPLAPSPGESWGAGC